MEKEKIKTFRRRGVIGSLKVSLGVDFRIASSREIRSFVDFKNSSFFIVMYFNNASLSASGK